MKEPGLMWVPKMRHLFTAFAVFGLCVLGSTQSAFADGVSVEVDREGALLVPCSFGELSGRCILDTGSAVSFVAEDPRTAEFERIGFRSVRSIVSVVNLPMVRVPSFRVDGFITKTDIAMARSNIFVGMPEYIGVVAAPFLAGQSFTLNLLTPMRLVSLSAREVAEMNSANTGKLYPPARDRGRIEIEVSIDGEMVHAMWDTHAGTSFTKEFVDAHSGIFVRKGSQANRDSVGHSAQTESYSLKSPICMGATCALPLWDVTASLRRSSFEDTGSGPIDMILGSDFVYDAKWSFDYVNQRYSVILNRP